MGGRFALSLAVALAAGAPGCASERHSGAAEPLPRAVAVAVVVTGGQPLTAYFSVLPNQRGHIDVRVANNLQLPGAEGVFRLVPNGPERTGWTLREELGHAQVPLRLPETEPLRPVRFEFTSAWLFPEAGPGWKCDLRSGACEVSEAAPELELTHPGPGDGFRLHLDGETLRFRQPHQADSSEGEIVATRVLRLLSVRWLHEPVDEDVQEHLDRTFRGRVTLRAASGPATADGVMDEWAAAEPAVVDAPWQAGVREHWMGPSDASFSVAARAEESRVCFGGRFRDDDLTEGDTLTFAMGHVRTVLNLTSGVAASGSASTSTSRGEAGAPSTTAVVEPEVLGWHYELCTDRPARSAERPEITFAAWYTDQDGVESPDELGTAPLFGATPTGTLAFVR